MRLASLEDDLDQARHIEAVLREAGHEVVSFNAGHKLIRFLEIDQVDMLILDWHVPDISGLEVLIWVRTRVGADLPILFLSNSSLEHEVARALNAGADDYLIKPVRDRELNARVAALLRRVYRSNASHSRLEVGDYLFDLDARSVTVRGAPIALTPREFDVASILFRNFGKMMPRDLIATLVWGPDPTNASRNLDTYIYRVRHKLTIGREHGVRLRTIYTHGYRLESWPTE